MNLENLLGSWQPRRPAVRIRSRLCRVHEPKPEFGWTLRWLVPAAACGLIALAAVHQDSAFLGLGDGGHPHDGINPVAAASVNGAASNRPGDFFEWTNRSGSAFNVRSFLPGKTN